MKTCIQSLAIVALATISSAFFPKAQAVVPPPDGGYPGGNTAEGQNALLSLTTGGFNTAVGFFSLRSDTGGSLNTAIGAPPLQTLETVTRRWVPVRCSIILLMAPTLP
jgi:hypothetical protein